jgi:hypothetical protein
MPRWTRGGSPGASAPLSEAQREEIVSKMEDRWLREPVPALGGRTPVDAASDPIGREEVARLIDSFPVMDESFFTMRPAKLRAALGL